MADETDWGDPCQAASALRTAYFAAMSGGGGQVVSVRFNDREVRYSSDPGSISALRDELRRQEALCRIASGQQPARHAMKVGDPYRKYLG